MLGFGAQRRVPALEKFPGWWGNRSADMYNPMGCVQGWRQAWCTAGAHNPAWAIREGFLEAVSPELSLREWVGVCVVGGGSS